MGYAVRDKTPEQIAAYLADLTELCTRHGIWFEGSVAWVDYSGTFVTTKPQTPGHYTLDVIWGELEWVAK